MNGIDARPWLHSKKFELCRLLLIFDNTLYRITQIRACLNVLKPTLIHLLLCPCITSFFTLLALKNFWLEKKGFSTFQSKNILFLRKFFLYKKKLHCITKSAPLLIHTRYSIMYPNFLIVKVSLVPDKNVHS